MMKTYLIILGGLTYSKQVVTNEVLIDFKGETQIFSSSKMEQ